MYMYKTISITNKTYQELNNLAIRLNKPKSHLIDELLLKFKETMKEKDKKELLTFNTKMQTLINKIKLPEGSLVSTDTIDHDFSVLQDTTTEI